VGVRWDFDTKVPVPLTLGEYRWPKNAAPLSPAGAAYSLTNVVAGWPQWLTNVTIYPKLQDVWDMNRSGVAAGSVSVQEPFNWQRLLFDTNGIMDWSTPDERGLDAGSGGDAVTELRYFALLSTAGQFKSPTDWRWLGPLSANTSPAIGLLVNDAGMLAGYAGISTGDPAVDALRSTHAFRAPVAGEYDGTGIILNDLGVLTNGLHSFPRAMNADGNMVGYSDFDITNTGGLNVSLLNSHAVYWAITNTVPEWLTNYPASTSAPYGYGDAFGINDSNQIVGASMTAGGQPVGVLWQRNHNTNDVPANEAPTTTNAPFWEITTLNDRLTDASWQVFRAVDINNDGLMLAHAFNAAGAKHAVLLATPQLAVDANRDETITFDDADKTTAEKPYRFWLNDDMDVTTTSSEWADPDPEVYPPTRPDSSSQILYFPRDCEDLTRLWLDTGNLLEYVQDQANDLYFGLKWENVGSDTPAIRLFYSADSSGGLGHIKDATIAQKQVYPNSSGFCLLDAGDSCIDQVRPTTRPADFIFNKNAFADLTKAQSKLYLLFEGVSEGKGQLRLVLLKKNGGMWQSLGEGSSVWLELKNIQRMYVRAYSTPLPEHFPLPWQDTDFLYNPPFPYQRAVDKSLTIPDTNLLFGYGDSTPADENQQDYPFEAPPDEQKKCVVFVHGIDLDVPTQQGDAQSFFKRLWWEGYRGRFAAFRWSTTLDENWKTFLPHHEGTSIFNSGEYRSWKGGASLRKFVATLRPQFTTIGVAAHSLGNACTGEALRQGMQVESYVAMEAAVSASCYDPQAPTIERLIHAENGNPTPEFVSQLGYRGYLLNIGNASGASLTSYYNHEDFWLVTGHIFPSHATIGNLPVDWINSMVNNKPDGVLLNHYNYDFVTENNRLAPRFRYLDSQNLLGTRLVSDPHEGMAYVSRSRTGPLGAGAPGPLFNKQSVDMNDLYKFGRARFDHSGQFQRNIQLMYGNESGKQWSESFYHRLINDLHVGP